MTEDANHFRERKEPLHGEFHPVDHILETSGEDLVALYEAKMFHHFDHRFGTYEGQTEAQKNQGKLPELTDTEHAQPGYLAQSQYLVPRTEAEGRLLPVSQRSWLLGWRDITGSTVQRTVIASFLPRVAVGNTAPLLFSEREPPLLASLYANWCSFVYDYAARQKVGGLHLTFGYLKQLPSLSPNTLSQAQVWLGGASLQSWILPRVLELVYTAWDLEPWAKDMGWNGPPFVWNAERRFQLRCELDAAFFHLYGLSRDDTDYVMDTFPIVCKNDEKAHGEYRTKRVILEIYDALAEAAQSGRPYQTPLEPLPAAPGASHGVFVENGTPKNYAEALRMGLLFALIRRRGNAGMLQGSLARALLWLENTKHAATGFEGVALAEFERVRESDPLLAQGTSDVATLLQALENEKTITIDAKGVTRLRVDGTIPNWLPQTPTLAKLASLMHAGLGECQGSCRVRPHAAAA